MAALISAPHKLNYALFSCKSIPFITARGHILAVLYTFLQQEERPQPAAQGAEDPPTVAFHTPTTNVTLNILLIHTKTPLGKYLL